MHKSVRLVGLLIAMAPALGACGTYVPAIQELSADPVSDRQLVQAIIQNVTCEVRDAVNHLYAKMNRPSLFLDSWGAQITLNLAIEEKSELNPTAGWFPNAVFSLVGGVDASADATRTDIVNSYFTIRELRSLQACNPLARPGGAFLLATDLRLESLLFDSVTAGDTQQINFTGDTTKGPFGQKVISHEVKFVVMTSGTVTPAWKLSRVVSVNSAGTFFSAQRNRTHDLTITLGPTDDTGKNPSRPAADVALSSLIGVTVGENVRRAVQP